MHENSGDVVLSEAYPRALFERVEANDATIRIVGEAATLEQVMAGTASRAESKAAGASVFADRYRDGAPDRIRTCDLCLRRAALYPAELRVPGSRAGSGERIGMTEISLTDPGPHGKKRWRVGNA